MMNTTSFKIKTKTTTNHEPPSHLNPQIKHNFYCQKTEENPSPRHTVSATRSRTHLLVLFHTIKWPMSAPRNLLTTHHTVPRTRARTHTHPSRLHFAHQGNNHSFELQLCNPIYPRLTPCFPCLRTNNGIARTHPAHNPTLMPH